MPALFGVERLTLDYDGERILAEWQDGAVDGATWRELLGPFIGARELHICCALTWELSSALQLDDVGLDPGLLPSLQELVPDIEEGQVVNGFASFIDICQVAGHPVRLCQWPRTQNLPTSLHYPKLMDMAFKFSMTPLKWRGLLKRIMRLPNSSSSVYHRRTLCSLTVWMRHNPPIPCSLAVQSGFTPLLRLLQSVSGVVSALHTEGRVPYGGN